MTDSQPRSHHLNEISDESAAVLLSKARRAAGYSIEEIALTTGLAADEIVRIENGDDVDKKRINRLAHALKVPLSRLG